MKFICLFFEIHQPFRHRRYRFFDIGNDHYYYDDYSNETTMMQLAKQSYLPANILMRKLIEKYKGKFKVAYSISGTALELFKLYAPEVIDSFKELAQTGCVEFLSETYSHSLASLNDPENFSEQVRLHDQHIFELFGQEPRVFRNTEMIYSDRIGDQLAQMGFSAILTEGARQVLGWKSPNFLYVNAINPRLKVLMRNFKLSDDIAFRLTDSNWSEYPLTSEKFLKWIASLEEREEVVNLFLNYNLLGEEAILDFFKSFAKEGIKNKKLKFATPSEIVEKLQPVSAVSTPAPISWADEERDLTPWQGNEMQKEVQEKLNELNKRMLRCQDSNLLKDWYYLQSSDHFRYMSTKHSSDSSVYAENPFDTPYEAFINYMNVLSDFKIRLNAAVPENQIETEIAMLQRIIDEKDAKIQKLQADLERIQKSIKKGPETIL